MGESNLVFWIVVMILGYGLCAIIAFLFAFRPEILVRHQARNYRKYYKNWDDMSNVEIDRTVNRLWFFLMIDSWSHFIKRGVEYPEEFPKLIWSYRLTGCFLWIALAVAIFFLTLGLVTGGLSISR
ncbi:MAG: hypothetical protein EYC68_17450 [Chloroflexota bacterium]|nr:MAG: hypothetical protein EYC68_17450 [Chloroflexota bacterium]